MDKIKTEKGVMNMPKFVPLTFLKDTASIVEFCQECGEPVFVTRNGLPEIRSRQLPTVLTSSALPMRQVMLPRNPSPLT